MTDSNMDPTADANCGRGDPSDPEWRAILAPLQEDGCSILVTGQVGETDSAAFMRKRGYGVGAKHRVLALSHVLDVDPDAYLRDDWTVDDEQTHIITRQTTTRSAAATNASSITPSADTVLEFQTEIVNAASPPTGTPASSLRIAVDSVGRLIEDHSESAILTMMNGLNTSLVRGLNGRIYYHYRRRDDAEIIQRLSDHVDARIELGYHNDGLIYRWHIPSHDQTSKWMTVTEV